MDPDAQRGRRGRPLDEAGDGLLHRHGGEHRAPRRVLDGVEAECGQYAGRAHAVDGPAEGTDLVEDGLERAVRVERCLRVGARSQGRAEQRHASPFPAEGRERGRGTGRLDGRREPPRGTAAWRRGTALGGQVVLLDARAQRVAGDAEGPRRARDVPARLTEDGEDVLAHGVVERRPLSGGRPRRSRGRAEPQHRRRQLRRVREHAGALHHVDQLADVAGPRVGGERRARVGGECLRRHAVLDAGARQEVLGQAHDVLAALPERGHRHREHREPVVEVLAEAPLPNGRPQIFVGGREDPDVDRFVACAPEPAHRALLEDLEELRLQRLGEESDLVEKDRAPVRGLEEAGLGAPRVGEGAALEPEHLRLEEGFGNRGAVDVDERTGGTRSRLVDHSREQPLAGARFALDEDRWEPPAVLLAVEQPFDPFTDRLDLRAVTEQIRQDVGHVLHHTLTGQLSAQHLTSSVIDHFYKRTNSLISR